MKKKIFYKILTATTLILPMSVYLFLSATILNVKADYNITLFDNAEIMDYELENSVFLYNLYDKIEFKGGVIKYLDKVDSYGVEVFEGDIVKINNDYFVLELKENKLEFVDIDVWKLGRKESVNLPIALIISIVGAVIVGLIYAGKMQVFKKNKRLAVWVSLLLGTGILFLIDMIVSNMLNVFLVATVSWTIYCLEYVVLNGVKDDNKVNNLINELQNML